jgi:hypothetical protein
MSEHLPQTDDERIEHLFQLLKDASVQEPSPHLRERIAELSAARLQSKDLASVFIRRSPLNDRWAFVLPGVALVFAAILILRFIPRPMPQGQLQARQVVPRESVPSSPRVPGNPSRSARALAPARPHLPKPTRRRGETIPAAEARNPLTVSLPYSNSEISTGNSTIVRVSMPQSQLAALGLPLPALASNSRILADVTLGDDGLPKSISLPLPLQVLKEN